MTNLRRYHYLAIFFALATTFTPFVVRATSVSLSSSSIIELTGEETLDAASIQVTTVGDVNNDNYDDFLVASKTNDATGSNAGAAYLVYGQSVDLNAESLSGTSNTVVKFTGEAVDDYGGTVISSAGDVDADGYDDFLIGAYHPTTGNGAAYLVYGQSATYTSPMSLGDDTIVKFSGEALGDAAGAKLSAAGDVNNDGYDDFLIAANSNDDSFVNAGAIYLYYGQAAHFTDTDLSTAAIEFTGEQAYDTAGSALGTGNFNKDAYDDIIIGAAGYDPSNYGRTYVYFGQADALVSGSVSTADVIYTGENAEDAAGGTINSAGDLNQDGYDDMLIGAVGNDDAGVGAGAVYIVYGSDTLTSGTLGDIELTGEAAGDNAGYNVSSAGDVNNDGYKDYLVGAPLNDDTGEDAGAAYLFFGESSFLSSANLSTAAITFNGEAAGDRFGTGVGMAGDVNGDGYDDLIIGARYNDDASVDAGAAYLVYARPSTVTITNNTDATNTVECATGTFTDPGATATDQYTNTSLAVSTTDSIANTPVGTDTITYTTADNTLQITGTATRTVTISDTTAPVLTLLGEAIVTVEQDSTYTDDGVSVTEACTPGLTASTTGTVDTTQPGNYTLTYSATDAEGNIATPVSRTVTVTAHGDIHSATKDDGYITLVYDDGYTQSIQPFGGSTKFVFTLTTNQLGVVTTNGKLVRVFVDEEKVDQQKINRKTLHSKFITLKVKKLYRAKSYDDIMIMLAKKTYGKIHHLRLTSAYQLTKFEHQRVLIVERRPGAITVRPAKHRFTTWFGSGAEQVKSVWRVTRHGRLTAL